MLPSATEIRAAIEASVACEHNAAANKPEFVINSEERLNWLASKLNNYQAIIDSQEAILASKLKQLDGIREEFLAEHARSIAPFKNNIESLLHRFALQALAYTATTAVKGAKSREVAGITFGYRKRPSSLTVQDQNAFLGWVSQQELPAEAPEVFEVKLKKSAVKEVLKLLQLDAAPGVALSVSVDEPFVRIGDNDVLNRPTPESN